MGRNLYRRGNFGAIAKGATAAPWVHSAHCSWHAICCSASHLPNFARKSVKQANTGKMRDGKHAMIAINGVGFVGITTPKPPGHSRARFPKSPRDRFRAVDYPPFAQSAECTLPHKAATGGLAPLVPMLRMGTHCPDAPASDGGRMVNDHNLQNRWRVVRFTRPTGP